LKLTLLLLFVLSTFMNLCHAQNPAAGDSKSVMDSLKTELQKAKQDTTRLKIYLAMGDACEKKDNLLYAEPALKLVDKILSQTKDDKQRNKILEQEYRAYNLLIAYYSNGTSIDWEKIIAYAKRRLKAYEDNGDKKRIAETFSNMAGLYQYKNDTAEFISSMQKSLEISIAIKDTAHIVNASIYFCQYYLSTGNFPMALEAIQKAISISGELNYKKGTALCLSVLGDMYRDNGEVGQALENYQSALSLLSETKDTNDLFNVLAAMGGFYYTLHNADKALEYYNQLIELCNAKKDMDHDVGSVYKWIGLVYEDKGDYTNSLLYFQKSLSVFDLTKNKWQVKKVLDETGTVYYKQGDLSKAIDFHLNALKIAQELNAESDIGWSYQLLARDYSGQNNYKAAKEYSDRALFILKKQFDVKSISEAELLASEIDSARGDGTGAYKHYKQYILLSNKLKGDEISKAAQKENFQNEFDKQKSEQEKKDIKQRNIRNFILAGLGGTLIFLVIVNRQRKKIKKEKKRSDELLLNILPEEVAEELKAKGRADAKHFDEVTVMFTDFKNFTRISEKLSPAELVAEIDTCFKAFDNIIGKHNIEKIKTIGDAYMCAGGLPVINKTNATDVVSAAMEIQQFMQQHLQQRKNEDKEPFEIRIGVHTGAVVAGIVGVKKFAYDIWGDTVNIASRMESSGESGKVNISGSTYELVKDKFNCTHRGKIQAKNKGEIDMYFAETVS
jgi:adenylate cyclase